MVDPYMFFQGNPSTPKIPKTHQKIKGVRLQSIQKFQKHVFHQKKE